MINTNEGQQGKLGRALRFACLLAFGMALGVAGESLLVATPTHADDAAFCENDRCKDKPWWVFILKRESGTCVDNRPHNTSCDVKGNHCRTLACGDPTSFGPNSFSGSGR